MKAVVRAAATALRQHTRPVRRSARLVSNQIDPYIAGLVKNRILKGYPELHSCYKAFLETKPAQKSGKLRIDWQIATSGRVISPEVVTTDLGNKPFETCVTRKIAE